MGTNQSKKGDSAEQSKYTTFSITGHTPTQVVKPDFYQATPNWR